MVSLEKPQRFDSSPINIFFNFFLTFLLTVDYTPWYSFVNITKTDKIMKKSILSLATIVLFGITSASAQNWKDLDAKSVKTLAENKLIRSSEVTIMPGEKGQVHTHPAHFFYALTDCHLVIHYTDGKE